ncbi:MAG: hypothetical protein ACLUEU_00045 [Oscillospiraceae bacterium]
MKSLILTAQDARELDKLGGLTVTKQIKPAPRYIEGAILATEGRGEWYISVEGRRLGAGDGVADMFVPPVQLGDAVYIREPWYRLKSPRGGDSERVILAADCVVAEDQVSYKWASPVSMPEDAARRFARVKSIGAAYGETVTPAWMIELEAISKDEALAADAGVPFSTATDPEEGSTYLTYAGDMSVEDHERMIAAINADRARLYEVQNRLIRIDLRRRELSSLVFEERDKVDPNDRDALEAENTALDEEQGNLSREESDLRAALEDAGAPAPTIEEHARELLTTIDARLRECDAADNEDRAEYNIGEEERDLIAERDVLTAYLSANNVEETPERAEGGLSPSDPPAGEAAAENTAAAEDEEIGSFTIGKCKYCGREWGVTLEGAREGGFPTQRTADAAATRLCDCEEAVANRAPIVGVAMAITTGACKYCGQIQEVGPHPSQAAADETASEVCNCPTARQERRVHEQVEDACERVQRLFGDDAESLGFKPIPDEAVGLLENVVEMIARGPISSASLNVRGRCKAKFSITSKGKIKVSRSETRSCDLEDGE